MLSRPSENNRKKVVVVPVESWTKMERAPLHAEGVPFPAPAMSPRTKTRKNKNPKGFKAIKAVITLHWVGITAFLFFKSMIPFFCTVQLLYVWILLPQITREEASLVEAD